MRALFTALCQLLLRLFFRRIDSVDRDRVPAEGPLLYVLNHPNGLIDPLFILCRSPRPVTFLAKAPLFHTFMVRRFVRAFNCLPVYRRQDGADTSKNREIIERSITLLGGAEVLALFPEGTSHSDPALKPIKTGAARIALSASARPSRDAAPTPSPVRILPVGLHYSQKTRFRSSAMLIYGEPIATPQIELDADLRPPAEAVENLNATIEAGLAAVTLQARDAELLRLADQAERILAGARRDAQLPEWGPSSGHDHDPPAPPVDPELGDFGTKRRLLAGYRQMRARDPDAVEALVARIRAYAAEHSMLGLPLDHPPTIPRRAVVRYVLRHALILPLSAPLSLLGILSHWPAYRGVGWLSARVASRDEDEAAVLATFKLAAGLLLFPLTWALMAAAAGVVSARLGGPVALTVLVGLVVAPLSGWAAMLFTERVADLLDRARGLWVLTTRADIGPRLASERRSIYDAVVAMDARLDGSSTHGTETGSV